ncbi:MAG TPA: helix-turn-helix domain-containing protein [Acidimicrobiia bacterium]
MSIEALNWAWEQPVSKAATKLVLLALADHSNADGECWPSMKRIAERSDISPRHVSRAIDELVDLGLVEKSGRRRHGGQYRGWDYRLLVQRTPASIGHPLPVTSGHGRPSPADAGVRSEPSENRQVEPLADKPPESSTNKKDETFETLAEVCGISLTGLTRSARGQLNRAAKELREVEATPDMIRAKAKAYKAQYPNATLTPTALVKHWASFAEQEKKANRKSIWETYDPPESYYL